MKQPAKVIGEWIEKVNTEASKPLNNWEEGFMMSITSKFETSGWISDREEEILERIYVNKTD